MALIYFVSALALGAALTRRIRLPLYRFEAVALTIVLGLFTWVWLAFLACLVLPYDAALPLTVAVSLAVAFALWYRDRTLLQWRALEGGRRGWILWAAATGVTTLILGRLFWTHSLVTDSTGVYSAGSTWGDFGLHASIISHLNAFDSMPMDLSVASGEQLTYPFLIDLLSALYVHGGWSLHLALFVPGVLLCLAICQLVMSLSLRMFGQVGAAVLALGLTLTTGSAAGTWVAWREYRSSGRGLAAYLGDLPRDYTTNANADTTVANLVSHALLPQRGMLLGWGVALLVFILVLAYRDRGSWPHLLLAGVLTGLLPMAHPHSFIVCMAVLGTVAVEAAVRARRLPRHHLIAAGAALLLAAPQLAWQQFANGHGTGGRAHFGWTKAPGESIWTYWWSNFGLAGVFFVVLPLLLWRWGWKQHLLWYAPFAALLMISQVYVFQPYEFDNLKLVYYVYLAGALFAGYLIVRAYRANSYSLLATIPAVAFVALPGVLSVVHEFELKYQFAGTEDLALASWVRENTRAQDVFLGTDRPNNPVATLGGRAVVFGFRGWLYSYSVPYDDRLAAVVAALQGRVDDPAVRRFSPRYLVVSTSEGAEWTVQREALANVPVAYQNSIWTVYTLPAAPTPATAAASSRP